MARANRFSKSKNINSKRYKRDLAEYLNGRALKCVAERVDDEPTYIFKSGVIIKKDDELTVYSGSDVILRTKISDLYAWELMSLEGVVIRAIDIEHGGVEREIIAFYTYWRDI